jgi:hypothetical protein
MTRIPYWNLEKSGAVVREPEQQYAILAAFKALDSGTQQRQRPGRNLHCTSYRLPHPSLSPIKVIELAVGGNPYVFIEAKNDLADADGDLFELSPVQKAQVDVSAQSVHLGPRWDDSCDWEHTSLGSA